MPARASTRSIAAWGTALALLIAGAARGDGDEEPAPADGEPEERVERVVPVFDPGSHVRPILDLGFSADGKKLITAGADYTVQVWSVATGERLDMLRLPPYGQEEGSNGKEWNVAAVSPGGKLVAVGGGQKMGLSPDNARDRAKLVLVDVEKRELRRMVGSRNAVTALQFSPDGSTLAVAYGGAEPMVQLIEELDGRRRKPRRPGQRRMLTAPAARRDILSLAFSPDGSRLLAAGPPGVLCLWDLSRDEGAPTVSLDVPPETSSLAWSPDGRSFVRSRVGVGGSGSAIELRGEDGALVRKWTHEEGGALPRGMAPWDARWIDDHRLLVTAFVRQENQLARAAARLLDVKSGTSQEIMAFDEPGRFPTTGRISPDGKLGVLTAGMGLDAVVYRMRDGSEVSRCGAKSPIPSTVGWSKRGPPRIAWSETPVPGRMNTDPKQFEVAFDLETLELVADFDPADFQTCVVQQGEWNLRSDSAGPNVLELSRGTASIHKFRIGNQLSAGTLIPRGDEPPYVLLSARQAFRGLGLFVLADQQGKTVARLLPSPVAARDLVPSPDGRYVLCSTGTHRLCIHRTDGSRFPVLSLARVRGDWVGWSGSGHYVGSPGGERMFGWAVHHGHGDFATFQSSEHFAKHLRRPDLLKQALSLKGTEPAGPVEERAPDLARILPPKAGLQVVRQRGGEVAVKGTATADAPDKPVKSLRLLLDGKALPGGQGLFAVPAGKPAETTWTLEIPSGPHELKLLAKGDEGAAISEPLVVRGPRSTAQLPTLHRLCVGVGEYRNSALNLASAAKDAVDLYGALETLCVGPENRFGRTAGKLLVDKQATRAAVLEALRSIRGQAKPGDLVVLQFAGHGVKQGSDYYLMTVESDPSQPLAGKAVSGTDLREALVEVECPVLLLLDACHAAAGARAFLPATADLTRNLSDEMAGVTVMAAAMAHEKASGTDINGFFTAGLLKGLSVGPEAFDPYDHVLYTHHVFSVVFSEVRRASKGRQNPCLTSPWTMSPLGLREAVQTR